MNAQFYEQQLLASLQHPEQVLIELDRLDSAESFASFAKLAWHVLEPGTDLKWGWALDAICDHLQATADGRIKKLLITVPPGCMKSLLTSVLFPAWLWTVSPHLRIMSAAHKQDLAIRDNMKFRRLVLSEWYQSRWPVEITSDQNTKSKIENGSTGFRECMAFTSVTGARANYQILDDPLSVNGAESDAERKGAEDTFRNAFYNRSAGEDSVIILIMQRLHERDVAGVIGDLGLPFVHLCLPMEFEPDRRCETPIEFVDPRTQEGELLFPELFSEARVEDLRKALDSYSWAGQYQQRPAPRGGGFLKPHLIEIVDDYPRDATLCRRWDFAATEGGGDYTVGALVAFKDGQGWIVDLWRNQVSAAEVEVGLMQTAKSDRHGVNIVLEQEPGSSGKWFVQNLTRKLAGYPVYTSRPDQKKELRARPLSASIEAGNIKMIKADWNKALIDEFSTFPNGAHDDIVDAVSDAWLHLSHDLFGASFWVG